VDPDLDVITMAVKVPETLAHLHYWSFQLTRPASKDEVLDAFSASSRITLIRMDAGLTALDMVKELMAEVGRSMTRGTMFACSDGLRLGRGVLALPAGQGMFRPSERRGDKGSFASCV